MIEETSNEVGELVCDFYKKLEFQRSSKEAAAVKGEKNLLVQTMRFLAEQIECEHVQRNIDEFLQFVLLICYNQCMFKDALKNYLLSYILEAI